jgi:hypothetical protein
MAFKLTRRRTPARAGLGECRRRCAPPRLAPLRRVGRPGVERAPDGQSPIGPVADKLCSSARRDRDFVRSLLCRPRRPSARPCCQAGRPERAEPGAPGPFARCIRRADVRDLAGASACLVRRGASDRAVRCSSLPPCRRPPRCCVLSDTSRVRRPQTGETRLPHASSFGRCTRRSRIQHRWRHTGFLGSASTRSEVVTRGGPTDSTHGGR